MAPLDARQLTCVDASGVHLAMTRLYGRAPRGERGIAAVPRNDGPHVPILGARGIGGSAAVMTVEGATDAAVLMASVEHGRAPTVQPGDIVGMDTLRAHQVAGVQATSAACGARLRSWPPSSPDLSPIAPCWSKRTTDLRKVRARTREALETAMTAAVATLTEADARGWFAHAGDALH